VGYHLLTLIKPLGTNFVIPVHAIKYRHLLDVLPAGVDEHAVLSSLRACATLVCGCWVVNSDRVFPMHVQSTVVGQSLTNVQREMNTQHEALRRARDYIVCVRRVCARTHLHRPVVSIHTQRNDHSQCTRRGDTLHIGSVGR
jgi:hypothetical protein